MTQPDLDKYACYEACVQSPADLVPLLRAIHGADPRVLAEDFAGTAALSLAWVERVDGGRAIATDHDPAPLGRHPGHARVLRRVCDVLDAGDVADVLFVGNFSIGYHHTRADLLAYLRHARGRLEAGGSLVCDTYGGESAFLTGAVHRLHPGPGATTIRYTWEQRAADPLTGRVLDVLSFRVERAGTIVQELPDAFVYDWRLWSVPELRDAMIEAGFTTTEVYAKLPDAVDDAGNAFAEPVTEPEDLDDSFIVLVAARV